MNRVYIVSLTSLLVFSVFVSRTASGEEGNEKEVARKHFEVGLALLKGEDWNAAVTELEASVDAYPTRSGIYNLAYCYKALHRYQEALETFDRLLTEFSETLDDEMRTDSIEVRAQIEAMVVQMTIEVDQNGAEIRVDDIAVGKSPLTRPLILGVGEHEVAISLEGYESEKKRVTLTTGKAKKVQFTLKEKRVSLHVEVDPSGAEIFLDDEPIGRAPLVDALDLAGGEYVLKVVKEGFESIEQDVALEAGENRTLSFVLTRVPAPVVVQTQVKQAPKKKVSPAFWVMFAGTLAVGAAGGVFWGVADRKYEDFGKYDEKYIDTAITNQAEIEKNKSERETAANDTKLYSNLALGFGIGAGALAITSVIILLAGSKEDKETDDTELSVVPGGLKVRF